MENRYPKVQRRLVEPAVIGRLSAHDLPRWLAAVALEWAIIAATLFLCFAFPRWWVWVIGFFVIGTRQHGLAVLGHEGSHFLVTRSRRWNDLLANFLTCYPLLFTVEGYRASHLEHHWYLETPDDPSKITVDRYPGDWTFPATKARIFAILLRDLSGFSQASSASLLKYLWDIPGKRRHMAKIALLHLPAIAAGVLAGHPLAYPVLWLGPLFTVAVTCYRIRATAEHSGFGDQRDRYRRDRVDALITTRTSIVGPLLAPLLAPYNVTYHIEHHLYPSVPGFNLKRLHRELLRSPEYRERAHLTVGYRRLFDELTAAPAS